MDEENGIYIPDAVCSAMQIVRSYINCDCGSEMCPYDSLLLAVQEQEKEQRKEREQETYNRQREVELKRENEVD